MPETAAPLIEPSDLAPFATITADKAQEMIEDALGQAEFVAPCIFEAEFKYRRAAKGILRGAILRWNDAGSGAITTQQAGPFQQVVDSTTRKHNLFWPSEIAQLQNLCRTKSSGAFAVDTHNGPPELIHDDGCDVYFDSGCSCGVLIAQVGPYWGGV